MPTFRSLATRTVVAVALSTIPGAVAVQRDLHIVNKVISPDGFTRDTVLADGVMPGPLISGQKGDTFQLNVINELHDQSMLQATSIHWHGFFQQGTSWADGPAFVTQCPIMPNSSFLYEFSVPDQAGTFWYHSHYSTQYCDGLRGPFVVYDPNDPLKGMYDVDDDSTVITLSDWYHRPAPSLNDQPPNNRLADSTLINGNGRWDDGTQIVGSLSTISVTPGQSYRFRLVSLSCDPTYNFSIDGHTLTVIETDGVATKPTVVDQIQIFAGQRYSFVLNANQSVDNYWIRAGPVSASSQTDFIGGKNSAILRYVGAPDAEPTTQNVPSIMPLQEWTLEPFVESPPPSVSPEDIHSIQVGFVNGHFAVNNVPFTSPSVDVLLQILSGVQDPNSLLPAGSIIPLAKNRTIELQFSGGGDHPFHLHGHNFWVMQSAGSTVQPTKPILRDVVNIGGNSDNVRVRFQTNNPGPWFLHCHIDWHLEAGLAVILAEDIPGIAQNTNPPPAWEDLCKNFVPEVPSA